MKKSTILLTIIILFSSLISEAHVLSPNEALGKVVATYEKNRPSRSRSEMQLERTFVDSDGLAAVYLFGANGSAMLVSAESTSASLLGRFDTPSYSKMPPQLESMIKMWVTQIDRLRHDANLSNETRSESKPQAEIVPMVRTQWNQNSPYNGTCPTYNGVHAMAGCTPVAFSQYVNYYRYPSQGHGSYSYNWSSDEGNILTVDLDSFSFDWDNMPTRLNESSEEIEKRSIQRLLRTIGILSDAKYTIHSTSAAPTIAMENIKKYMNYQEKAQRIKVTDYTIEDWKQIIYDHLSHVGPVILFGENPWVENKGHCFIVDGYKDGLYHMNWGWGGACDGYFRLFELTPGGNDFSGDNQMIVNLVPPGHSVIELPTYKFIMSRYLNFSIQEGKLSAEGSYYELFHNTTDEDLTLEARLELTNEDGNIIYGPEDVTNIQCKAHGSVRNILFRLPELVPGSYKMRVLLRDMNDQNAEFEPLQTTYVIGTQYHNYCYLDKSEDGSIEWRDPRENIVVSDVLHSKLAKNQYCKISFTASNPSDSPMTGWVRPTICSLCYDDYWNKYMQEYIYAEGERVWIELEPRQSRKMEIYTMLNGTDYYVNGHTTYLSMETSCSGVSSKNLSDFIQIDYSENCEQGDIELLAFEIEGDPEHADKDNLRFNVRVRNNNGYYSLPVNLLIFGDDPDYYGRYPIRDIDYKDVFLQAGEQKDFQIIASVSEAREGDLFYAHISSYKYEDGQKTFLERITAQNPLKFRVHSNSGINDLKVDGKTVRWYDLMGRELSHPITGYCIRVEGSKVSKTLIR